jgi:hypothetical protein
MASYRQVTDAEKKTLAAQGCRAADWAKVQVAEPFDASRVQNVLFLGECRIGTLAGTITRGGVAEPCGMYDAELADVTVGNGCLIKRVSSRIARYDIGDGAVIEDVGLIECQPGSTFGAGTVVDALNEGGGRGVTLYPELSAQVAHLLALHRYRAPLIKRLEAMIAARVAQLKSDRGRIGAGAELRGVKTIRDVAVGPAARIEGAALLEKGTILSEAQAPAVVGSGVVAREFLIAEGASVTDGALLEKAFIGQGCKIGKQFSAENCVFFANCEAFHGEGVAVFAGPYSATHHKSTLLIAGQFSFFNAGSGTNQSNHMYKLGPLHQGILERGSKTGSFSYLLWPCRVGPFSVVIGKNMANFDLGDLPFSYIEAHGNRSVVTPAYNLYTVGTVRDGAKWPVRDRRKASAKRDLINFPVISPYTAERMLRGEKLLYDLAQKTERSVEEITINGATARRLVLKSSAKYYTQALDGYLAEKLVARAEAALGQGLAAVQKRLAPDADGVASREWLDLSGLLVARERFEKLATDLASGAIADMGALQRRLAECHAAYERDEWSWVAAVWAERSGVKPHEMTGAQLAEAAEKLLSSRSRAVKMILADAEREFSETAQIGFGADGDAGARKGDFEAVRGTFAGNKFVAEMNKELETLTKRVAEFKAKAAAL